MEEGLTDVRASAHLFPSVSPFRPLSEKIPVENTKAAQEPYPVPGSLYQAERRVESYCL